MAKPKRNFRQKLQVFLFWVVVFMWLVYGSLVFLFMGVRRDGDTQYYETRMTQTKDTRDDAWKHPEAIGALFDQGDAAQGGMQEMIDTGQMHQALDHEPADFQTFGVIHWLWGGNNV